MQQFAHVICLLHEQIRAGLAYVSSHLRCKWHRFRSGAANCCSHKFHSVLQRAAATTNSRWWPDLASFEYGRFEGMFLYFSKSKKHLNTTKSSLYNFEQRPVPDLFLGTWIVLEFYNDGILCVRRFFILRTNMYVCIYIYI